MLKQVHQFDELEQLICSHLTPNTIVLLDVDNTIIYPSDSFFAFNSEHNQFIDELKAFHNIPTHDIVSSWRLQRQVSLMNVEWPVFLHNIHATNARVYGLTRMDTGTYGKMASVERWRASELRSMGLTFSAQPKTEKPENLSSTLNGPSFYDGIIFTGDFSKANSFQAFTTKYNINIENIIFVDDREEHAIDLDNYGTEHGIPTLSIHWQYNKTIVATTCEKRARIQKDYLLNKQIWLSDAQAEQIVQAQKN